MTPFANATITTTRAGSTVYSNRRVQLDHPTTEQRIMAQGADVPVQLWDVPSSDYKSGDVVQIVSIDGHSGAIHPARYAALLVEKLPAPLALTSVQLTGIGGAEP